MQNTTFSIIKPDAVAARDMGHILSMIEDAGFRIYAMKMVVLSHQEARQFYAVHCGKPFFDELCDFMSSGPLVAMVVESTNQSQAGVITDFRSLVGATDPKAAAPGTIRAKYARDKTHNAIHASDSIENAEFETAFFF